MSRSNLLPDELDAWLRRTPKAKARQQMRQSLVRRATAAGLSMAADTWEEGIEALDEQYFTLREAGQAAESMEYFRRARMLAALRFLQAEKDADALYEFIHSLREVAAAAAIAELEGA